MLDYDDYKVMTPFPARPNRPNLVSVNCTSEQAKHYAQALKEFEDAQDVYVVQRNEYNLEEYRKTQRFKADILADVGLTGHPKADAVYSLAWEDGHSSGLSEVAMYVEKYAELVKETK